MLRLIRFHFGRLIMASDTAIWQLITHTQSQLFRRLFIFIFMKRTSDREELALAAGLQMLVLTGGERRPHCNSGLSHVVSPRCDLMLRPHLHSSVVTLHLAPYLGSLSSDTGSGGDQPSC